MKENDKTVASIYETHDYEKFKPMKQNRGTVTTTGTKRRKLISILHLLETGKYVPELGTIRVNKNFEIIDGHHRLQALRQYQLPVRYEIIEDDRFNIATGREKLGHVYDANSINPAWTQTDMYKAALAAKAPVAMAIDELIRRHKNTFPFNYVLALLMQDARVFTGARKGSVNMQTFDDKKLIEQVSSNEFYLEMRFFNELNQKFAYSEKASLGFKAVYTMLWKYSLLTPEPTKFRGDFRKAVPTVSVNMLRNTERTRTFAQWLRLVIETYNKRNREKLKVSNVMKALGKIEE